MRKKALILLIWHLYKYQNIVQTVNSIQLLWILQIKSTERILLFKQLTKGICYKHHVHFSQQLFFFVPK